MTASDTLMLEPSHILHAFTIDLAAGIFTIA